MLPTQATSICVGDQLLGPRFLQRAFGSQNRPLTALLLLWPPIHKSSAPGTGLSGRRYFNGPDAQIFRSRDRPLRTSLLLWPPSCKNLPLPGRSLSGPRYFYGPHAQIFRSRDIPLITSLLSLVPMHKSSAPGTGLSGRHYFYGPHAQIFRSRDRPIRTSLLLCPHAQIFASSNLSGLTFLISSIWLRMGGDRLTQIIWGQRRVSMDRSIYPSSCLSLRAVSSKRN